MSNKEVPQPGPDFDFDDRERLYYRVSHDRFRRIFEDDATAVHRVELSLNSYGEFLFITLSRGGEQNRKPVTFYGLGYHEYRERWIHQDWYWYHAHPTGAMQTVDKEEARTLLDEREQEVGEYVGKDQQSRRAQLYEMLADLTDEDGAIIDMEDLGPLFDDLDE